MERVEILLLDATRVRVLTIRKRMCAYGDDANDLAIALAAIGIRADHPHLDDGENALLDLYKAVYFSKADQMVYLSREAKDLLSLAIENWPVLLDESLS